MKFYNEYIVVLAWKNLNYIGWCQKWTSHSELRRTFREGRFSDWLTREITPTLPGAHLHVHEMSVAFTNMQALSQHNSAWDLHGWEKKNAWQVDKEWIKWISTRKIWEVGTKKLPGRTVFQNLYNWTNISYLLDKFENISASSRIKENRLYEFNFYILILYIFNFLYTIYFKFLYTYKYLLYR